MAVLTFIYVIATTVVLLYLYSKWTYAYWKRRGVPSVEAELFYGNFKESLTEKIMLGEVYLKFYREGKAKGYKHMGVHLMLGKRYIPIDLELVKHILQKDFGHFVNRGMFDVSEEHDPLMGNLFNFENDKWRDCRTKLTPTFTSGKLKMMFQTLADTTVGLDEIFREHATIGDPVEIKYVIERFTIDVICSVAFGLESNTLIDPNSNFLKYGKQFFELTLYERLKFMFQQIVPRNVVHFLRMSLINKEIEDFFMKIVDQTVKYREENNIYRKDFFHLLLQLKNRGQVSDDGSIKKEGKETMTMNEFAAQCFVFFTAGFETSATTITFTLLELAQNQEIQDKLREEILTTLEKHGGKLTYDSVMEMSYLNKVVNETLRKHPPPAAIMERICNTDYTVPGTNVVIEKGTRVHIPIFGIHRDPEYYPDPEKFDPERFSEENKAKRPQFTFLSFGEGPRICIGARFGMMQSKVGIITAIKNYRITLHEKTHLPIEYDPRSIVLSVKGGVWLNLEKID